jgi:AICAR transformylase/IMP cyclohydrolase PurH
LGGRVKTLHPKIFGGILGRRAVEQDLIEMKEYGIPEIDLVIVDLYPFEETVASTNEEKLIIEKIDIGGPSMIRAAAKNFSDLVVIASKDDYTTLINLLADQNGTTSLEQRKAFAAKAIAHGFPQEYIEAMLGGSEAKTDSTVEIREVMSSKLNSNVKKTAVTSMVKEANLTNEDYSRLLDYWINELGYEKDWAEALFTKKYD